MTTERTLVIFVHGLWLHSDSWGAWVDLWREAGYDASALGWPGDSPTVEETRRGWNWSPDTGSTRWSTIMRRPQPNSAPSRSSSGTPSAAWSFSGGAGKAARKGVTTSTAPIRSHETLAMVTGSPS